jgi:hypothetical protein
VVKNPEDFLEQLGCNARCLSGSLPGYAGAAMSGLLRMEGEDSLPEGFVCTRTFRIQRNCAKLFNLRFDYPFRIEEFLEAYRLFSWGTMTKRPDFILHLRSVKNLISIRQNVKAALDGTGNQWDAFTDDDYPDTKCDVCKQEIEEGWLCMASFSHKLRIVCKRHVALDGKLPPKYRSIDD